MQKLRAVTVVEGRQEFATAESELPTLAFLSTSRLFYSRITFGIAFKYLEHVGPMHVRSHHLCVCVITRAMFSEMKGSNKLRQKLI